MQLILKEKNVIMLPNKNIAKEEMNMKKLLCVLLIALILTAVALTGCTNDTSILPDDENSDVQGGEIAVPEEKTLIRIAGLKGPTTMGLIKVLADDQSGVATNDYEFTIAGSADEITPKLIKGELDMAAVPANLASVLYNKTEGKVQVAAINTLGVIYIVEKGESINSLSDLAGKTIYATGKGSTPEYSLRYMLEQNGINPDTDVTIEWKSEPTEVVALLKQNETGIAMLPQPYVTVAQSSVDDLRIALNLNDEWNALDNGSLLVTGVLVVRDEFAESYPEALESFIEEYKASTEFVNANVSDAAVLIEKADIVKAAVGEIAIPYCNIVNITGEEMQQALGGYLQILYDANNASVGGNLPGEDFYYIAQ